MPAYSRSNIIKALSIIGLKKTFVALRSGDTYSVNRLMTPNGDLKLIRVGLITDPKPLVIGRIGMPDPNLGILWNNSMTFYGAWFDELAISDTDYRIRKSILGLSRQKLIEQVRRDDRYGLIGTFYAVFLEILELNKGVPIVVLDDTLLGLGSFPVIIPRIEDAVLRHELTGILRLMLRKELAGIAETADPAGSGLEVEYVSESDLGKYFPA
jgi:hypothetical protein